MPDKNQSIENFARELCAEKSNSSRDGNLWNQKNLCARRPHLST